MTGRARRQQRRRARMRAARRRSYTADIVVHEREPEPRPHQAPRRPPMAILMLFGALASMAGTERR